MNKKNIASLNKVLCAGLLSLGLVSTANAALVSTLGGLAVYDTDIDISWLADANYAKTSGFDADGRMTFDAANAWAAGLSVGDVTGWRLPSNPNTVCADGFNRFGPNCTAHEMGHLFYREFGGREFQSISGIRHIGTTKIEHIQASSYWTSTIDLEIIRRDGTLLQVAYDFSFRGGITNAFGTEDESFAWPVHWGDVGAFSSARGRNYCADGSWASGFARLRASSTSTLILW